jgi:phage portal protein BeeE
MNIFNLFKPKPANNSLSLSQTFSFGKAASGVDVTERTALNVSAVYACVRVVSEAIGNPQSKTDSPTRY